MLHRSHKLQFASVFATYWLKSPAWPASFAIFNRVSFGIPLFRFASLWLDHRASRAMMTLSLLVHHTLNSKIQGGHWAIFKGQSLEGFWLSTLVKSLFEDESYFLAARWQMTNLGAHPLCSRVSLWLCCWESSLEKNECLYILQRRLAEIFPDDIPLPVYAYLQTQWEQSNLRTGHFILGWLAFHYLGQLIKTPFYPQTSSFWYAM